MFVLTLKKLSLIDSTCDRKAVGSDGISNVVLKHFTTKAVSFLCVIINRMLQSSIFPSRWKEAEVVMIPKCKIGSNTTRDFRPISLLSCVGKIAEAVVLRRMQFFVESRNIVPDCQFGFRKKHSTTQQILRLVEHTTRSFDYKKYTGIVLLDIEKAFDRVWHDGLLYKLIQSKFPMYLIKLVRTQTIDSFQLR